LSNRRCVTNTYEVQGVLHSMSNIYNYSTMLVTPGAIINLTTKLTEVQFQCVYHVDNR